MIITNRREFVCYVTPLDEILLLVEFVRVDKNWYSEGHLYNKDGECVGSSFNGNWYIIYKIKNTEFNYESLVKLDLLESTISKREPTFFTLQCDYNKEHGWPEFDEFWGKNINPHNKQIIIDVNYKG